MTGRPGDALRAADDKAEERDRRFTNARANQKALAAREDEEAARDRELQRTLKAEMYARRAAS